MTSEALLQACEEILKDTSRSKEVSSAICDPLESLQAILETCRDEVDEQQLLVETALQRCKPVLDGLEKFLQESDVDLAGLMSRRSELLDAINTMSLARSVRFDPNDGLPQTQLQNLKLGFDSISSMLVESAASVFSPARGQVDDGTFTAEEMDVLDLITPKSSTRRTICPKASFPRTMIREEKRMRSIKLDCLCDKTEGFHDDLLEYDVKPYTFLVENVLHRNWRMCLHKPLRNSFTLFSELSSLTTQDGEELNELWEVLTLQLASRMSKASPIPFFREANHLLRQGEKSQEALAAETVHHKTLIPHHVQIEIPHGRMPLNGKPYLARLCHYLQSVQPVCRWTPSSTFKLMLFYSPPAADDGDALTVTGEFVFFGFQPARTLTLERAASKDSSLVRHSGRMGALGVTLKDVDVDQKQNTISKVHVKLQFVTIHDAAVFAAEFEAFRNRLLQIWAQRPFGGEAEVYSRSKESREYYDRPSHSVDGSHLRLSVISSPSKAEQSSLRMIMSKKGVPRWLCVDLENKAFRVARRGLLESLDLVRLWMVEGDDKDKLIVYQTNWQKMTVMAEAKRMTRVSDLGGTQLIRELQPSSDEWEDRIESVKNALKTSSKVKGAYKRVKVCVIDTGFDAKDKNNGRVVSYRDFAERKTDRCDETHHGTFSANLVLSIYDDCELYVARVFKTDKTDEETEPELMAQAIEWAIASPQNVDIISISAGFRRHSPRVESAVQKASCANKLVFAAAANWGNKELVAFPARHGLHTICIFATDVLAKASGFNPEGRERSHNFAVLGEGFPDPKDPRRQLKGTSMATAAAAGIAAFIVDFSRHRDNYPFIIRADGVGRMAGMMAVFDAISRPCGGYKCVSLSNLLPSDFDVKSWEPAQMRMYARHVISGAMDKAM
ncbi:putative subtilisin-like protease [Ophiocordyceps polyrhachis-furcata BCC 54312]|uniref:Subtilisin-like protease n=1 Tax=Ophiocordyceps polyrhachis-furcata BCC 54312 TaxID=1330021 RepID=A0A367L317_9HYPO|nr:putative subtilisin-like protease [Ophiocordyceps polyrhachis-furcata BCC 54312]